ncbi:MAG: ribonuclease P protein component [Ignavibacteria bacterium]
MTKVKGIYCLNKDEIIRGYNAFKNILTGSKVLSNGFLKLNIQIKKEISENIGNQIYKNPLANVKVGFVVSKRIVKKASLRNRLKRLTRESYRLNKYLLIALNDYRVYLLFSYSENYKDTFKNLKFDDVNENTKLLLKKAIEFINKKK